MKLRGLRLLVSGGRDFSDEAAVIRWLDVLHEQRIIECIIHGKARGLDSLAHRWATNNRVAVDPYPVTKEDWERKGKRAGVERNATMLVQGKPHAAAIWPGREGSSDMYWRVRDCGLPYWLPIMWFPLPRPERYSPKAENIDVAAENPAAQRDLGI